jgi:NADH:ubiquinone oxidoreductase subunit E
MEELLNKIVENYKNNEGNLISVLQELQHETGYIPEQAVSYLSEKLNIPASRFYGLATFYAQFYLTPRGKNIVTACCGTACHVKGSDTLIEYTIKGGCNIPEGKDTSEDGKFTLQRVACVGACSIAPVVIINKKVHGKVSPDKLMQEIERLKEE